MTDPAPVFEELARHTWYRIADGHRLAVRQGEVAITDYLLLEIARRRLPSIRVIKTPQDLEKLKGTDWEWWIGSRQAGWLRYAVQAKRIQYPNDYYDRLAHYVNGRPQVDLLTDYARINRAIPLYCFYNSTQDPGVAGNWNCNLPFEREQLGCTVVPVSVIRNALATWGNRSFQRIHAHKAALPWRCLVRCPLIMALYQNRGPAPAGASPPFGGAEVTVHPELPPEFEIAAESGEIERLDPRLFSAEVAYYPHHIAIIDIGDLGLSPTAPYVGRAV